MGTDDTGPCGPWGGLCSGCNGARSQESSKQRNPKWERAPSGDHMGNSLRGPGLRQGTRGQGGWEEGGEWGGLEGRWGGQGGAVSTRSEGVETLRRSRSLGL